MVSYHMMLRQSFDIWKNVIHYFLWSRINFGVWPHKNATQELRGRINYQEQTHDEKTSKDNVQMTR